MYSLPFPLALHQGRNSHIKGTNVLLGKFELQSPKSDQSGREDTISSCLIGEDRQQSMAACNPNETSTAKNIVVLF